jgi:DNA ligase 1
MSSTCFPFLLTTIDDDYKKFNKETILNVTNLKAVIKHEFMPGSFHGIIDPSDFAGSNVLIMKIENWDDNHQAMFNQPENWKTIEAFKQDFEEYPFIIATAEEHQQIVNNTVARDVFYVFFPISEQLSTSDLIQFGKRLQEYYHVSGVSYFSMYYDVSYGYEKTKNPIIEVNEAYGDLFADFRSGKLLQNMPFIQYYNKHIRPVLDFKRVYKDLKIVKEDTDHYYCDCPLHDDSETSFVINKNDLSWECHYGCGRGNPVTYVQRKNLLTYHDAVEFLSHKAAPKQQIPEKTLAIQDIFQELWEIKPHLRIYPINGELYFVSNPEKLKFKRVSNFSIQLLYRLNSDDNSFDSSMDYMVKVISTRGEEKTIVLKDKEFAENKAFKTKIMNTTRLSWLGAGLALDALKEYLMLYNPPENRMIRAIGYDKRSDCYLLGRILFDSQGTIHEADENGFFPDQNIYLDKRILNKVTPISEFDEIDLILFLDELFGAFGGKGILVFSYFVSTLFSRQIINAKKFFPFMSLLGDTHTGKTSLTNILMNCFFLNWPGLALTKSNTNKGLIREMEGKKSFVTPLTEGDVGAAKQFDEGMLKDMYHWNEISISARLGKSSETTSRKYEGGILFVQNNEWFDQIAVIERTVSLPFFSKDNSEETLKYLNKLESYNENQLASIGKQILERRVEIEPLIFEWIEKNQENLREAGCAEPRFIDNSAILGAGFSSVYKVFDLANKAKSDFGSFFNVLVDITKAKEDAVEDKAKAIVANHDIASLFFEDCQDLLENVDNTTGQPAPLLKIGEQYIIEDGLLYLKITETIEVLKKNGKRRRTPQSLLNELEKHPALVKRRVEKRSSLWTFKKLKQGERPPKPHCAVLNLSELDDIWMPSQTNTPVSGSTRAAKTPRQPTAKFSTAMSHVGALPAISKLLQETEDIPIQPTGTPRFGMLYKRTSDGKIEQWKIEVKDNKFKTISGQKDGKQTTSKWTECSGKNTGKSNATTDEEQALKEAKAKFNKQLAEDYHRKLEDVDNPRYVKPMLAHKFKDRFNGDFTNTYSQPKLDGMRCIVSKDGMFSRKGKPVLSAPHIIEALKPLFEKYPAIIFDGELYADALKDDFSKIISLAKKAKPAAEDLKESAEKLEFWVYDIISDDIFTTRYNKLSKMLKGITSIVVVPTQPAQNQDELDELFQGYLEAGMEGQMVRIGNSLYEKKRSTNLLKRKEFQDAEFIIVSLNEGKGNAAGMIKSVSLKTNDGIEFDSGIKGNQEYLKSLMENREIYVGGEATVKYQNLTPDGKPRFPITVAVYEEKRDT